MTKPRTFKPLTLVPTRSRKGGSVEEFSLLKMACIVFLFSISAVTSPAQTFTTLVSFNGTDGEAPAWGALVQGVDGNFYGTTGEGGAHGYGTVFKITPYTLTTLYNFCSQAGCTDGEGPYGGLVQATNGDFYGTTSEGGANGYGTVFKITPAGTLTTLHSFDNTDGADALAALVQATNGNFYGETYSGGANGDGTVFEITVAGTLTTLHSFDGTDGQWPVAGLIQATDGNFYGATQIGGASTNCSYGCGTIFKITPGGTLTTLHSFDGTDGEYPYGVLVQATNGNFYGTTQYGGASTTCSYGCGTIFEITPGGKLTTVHSFDNTDGFSPFAGLVQATDGNFYGATATGGAYGEGTVFEITPGGTLTTLHSFDDTDGLAPIAALVQATNGNFYGTTNGGGAVSTCNPSYGCGTVFRLTVGLGSFVETLPTSGKVGKTVKILGNNLTGTSSVSFNGTAATFTAKSTEIKTTVPTGATTGKVEVTTPKNTLSSNVPFRVTPQLTSFSPTGGPVGTVVTITGVSLTQTTKVTFGGVKATAFTVDSDTQVTATVPTGAPTGKIKITTAGGTAASATSFTVTTS